MTQTAAEDDTMIPDIGIAWSKRTVSPNSQETHHNIDGCMSATQQQARPKAEGFAGPKPR